MTVTAITQTSKGRYALFSEAGYLFSLDEETLGDLEPGCALSEAELSALKERSDTCSACDTALRWLARRAYAERELYGKLCLRYDEYSAGAALKKMCELGLMDDAAYAREKAEALARKGKSKREILCKLQLSGVAHELAAQAVERLDFDGAQVALALIRKHYAEKLRSGRRPAVMAALARRGFTRDEIMAALQCAEEG
jgi:regulatory protein